VACRLRYGLWNPDDTCARAGTPPFEGGGGAQGRQAPGAAGMACWGRKKARKNIQRRVGCRCARYPKGIDPGARPSPGYTGLDRARDEHPRRSRSWSCARITDWEESRSNVQVGASRPSYYDNRSWREGWPPTVGGDGTADAGGDGPADGRDVFIEHVIVGIPTPLAGGFGAGRLKGGRLQGTLGMARKCSLIVSGGVR